MFSFPQEELTFVLSLSQEEVELPLLSEFSTPEKLPLPPSLSLLQVAGERLKSRPLRNSIAGVGRNCHIILPCISILLVPVSVTMKDETHSH